MPEDEFREVLRPEIPSLLILLEHINEDTRKTAGSLLERWQITVRDIQIPAIID